MRIILSVLIILKLLLPANTVQSQPLSAVWPKQGQVVFSQALEFKWNSTSEAESYIIEIYADSELNTIVDILESFTNNSNWTIPEPNTYYWRIGLNSVESTEIIWSHLYTFQLFKPSQFNSLVLWLDPANIVHSEGFVNAWDDASGLNNNATQTQIDYKPEFIENGHSNINSVKITSFQHLIGSGVMGNSTEYSFFTVIKPYDLNTYRWVYKNSPLVGGSFSISTYAGNKYRFWANGTSGFSDYEINQPGNQVNYISFLHSNLATPQTKYFHNGQNVGSNSINITSRSEDGYLIGTLSLSSHPYNGEVFEFLLYKERLSEHNRIIVESYIRAKYFPSLFINELSLGYDIIIDYGFSPVILDGFNSGYQSYIWDTGQTTSAISTNNTGLYSLQVVDAFGFTSSDTIFVKYPENKIITNSFYICSGESLLLSSSLSEEPDYSFEWFKLVDDDYIFIDNQSFISVNEAGKYVLKVTDNESYYSYSEPAIIAIDDFSSTFTLGDDVQLCSGAVFSAPFNPNWLYHWDDGPNSHLITISETGNYSIDVMNANNCIARDTVFITIIGSSPVVDFASEDVCLGAEITFENNSFANNDDEIIYWLWDFGDGNTSEEENPNYTYSTFGSFHVNLYAEATSGCEANIEKIIVIKEPPIADFVMPYEACFNIPVQFTDISNSPSDENIVSWEWAINTTQFSSNQNPEYIFNNGGKFFISLEITASNSCRHTKLDSIIIYETADAPQMSSFVYPKNKQFFFSPETIEVVWNPSYNAMNYSLEVSKQQDFQNLIHYELSIENSQTVILPNFDTLYFRLNAFNLCHDSITIDSLMIIKFQPTFISDCTLWLAADSLEHAENQVIKWIDKSGNSNHASQTDTEKQPVLIENAINSYPAIKIDGGKFLNGTGDMAIHQAYSFFSIIKPYSLNTYGWIYKNSEINNNVSFSISTYASDKYRFWANGTSGFSDFEISQPANVFNYIAFTYENSSVPKSQFYHNRIKAGENNNSIVSSASNGYTLGLLNTSTHFYNGEIAEIILYSKKLTDSDKALIDSYLYNKYFNGDIVTYVNLGADIRIANGFCPVTIDAGERFESYLWSTGETTQSIEVNEPGVYGITVVDIFGFESSDSLEVRYPDVRLSQRDTIICFGDNLALGIQGDILPSYTYLWKRDGIDISTDQSIITDIAGLYELHVIDENDCFLTLRLDLDVDMFSQTTTLGADRDFCMGGELEVVFGGGRVTGELQKSYRRVTEELQEKVTGSSYRRVTEELQEMVTGSGYSANQHPIPNTRYPIPDTRYPIPDTQHPIPDTRNLSYLWSTGATTPSIIINEPGTYSVTVINEIGCIAEDTVTLGLQGYAPVVEFDAAAVCFGEPLVFTDQSYVDESEIVSWQWEFNDPGIAGGGSSVEQNPEFEYSTAGIFDINLAVTSAAGCVTDITEQVQVYHLPQPAFQPINACHNINIEFTDLSTSIDGLIENTHWSFIDSDGIIQYESDESSPVFIFDISGDWEISLISESDKGCSNEIIKEIYIRESPEIEFGYTAACAGEPVHFANLTTGPAWTTIIELLWDFGDGSQSNQNNPSHLYLEDGEFSVTLDVKSVNGCEISLTKDILVSANPEVSFSTPSLCKNTPHLFEDETFVPTGEEITAWLWNFGDGSQSNLQDPVHAYSETGQYDVMLTVESSAGCKGSRSSLVDVFPAPISDFSFYPRYGVSPLVVSFNNHSEGAQSYFWDFGDGAQYSNQENPSHTYTENGIYFPLLVATSELGCNDTISYEIKVIPLSIDIAITDVAINRLGNYLEISTGLFNLGTLDLDTIYLNLTASGSRPIRETWTGLLRAGDITNYTFSAQLPDFTGKDYDYVCVEATIPMHNPDDNPENNYKCKAIEEEFMVIPPYPNPAGNILNTGFILPYNDRVTVEIFDINGGLIEVVFDKNAEQGFNYLSIDISQLRGGVYFIKVSFRDGNVVKRFVKS